MSKTIERSYDPQFKMQVALDVIRSDKTLSQVVSENGISPSLACDWRDRLLCCIHKEPGYWGRVGCELASPYTASRSALSSASKEALSS